MALRDGRHFDGLPSLSGHCGRGWTCSLLVPVAHDPEPTLARGSAQQIDAYWPVACIGPTRQGALANFSTRKSRKARTLGNRRRPARYTADNGINSE